ncbi:MAG: hypothetical protein OSJ62_04280 [Lachnospiraceae bacterium]|nr:hypothetical protein [Lachnospiraceae bacterium]
MKIRKSAKALMAKAIVLSTTLLFVGCGTNATREIEHDVIEEETSSNKDLVIENDVTEENQDKDITNENDVTDNQKTLAATTNKYDSILTQYSDMVQNDFYMNLRDSDSYESSFGKDIALEIRTHKQNVYYTFYDIDGNGTMELIIAGGENSVSNPAFSPWNYDLYGYNGTNVVPIFPELSFGYRTNFSLYKNGVIEVFYNNSAAESGVDFYRIGTDGFTPERIDSFTAFGHLEGDEPVFTYFQNGTEITEEEYHTNIQNYEIALTTLDWIQIQ